MVRQHGLRRNSRRCLVRLLPVDGGSLAMAVLGHIHHLVWPGVDADQPHCANVETLR